MFQGMAFRKLSPVFLFLPLLFLQKASCLLIRMPGFTAAAAPVRLTEQLRKAGRKGKCSIGGFLNWYHDKCEEHDYEYFQEV